jgi:hypothetical protein
VMPDLVSVYGAGVWAAASVAKATVRSEESIMISLKEDYLAYILDCPIYPIRRTVCCAEAT